MQDVIVIGGSYAGMAAALQLARARRKVRLIDGGQRRNRFASHAHGFLGQDGVPPAQIWAEAQAQLLAYPTVSWQAGSALAIHGHKDEFRIDLADGDTVQGRRILLATGVVDQLPEVAGLAERWGQSVFHCPYCHGYELNQGRIGVIATGPMSLHQAQMLPEWGETTLLTNAALQLDAGQRADLARRGVQIEEIPINRISGVADVEMADGRLLAFAGLFTAPRTRPAGPLAEAMDLALMETPLGVQIQTDDSKETSIPGIFACGDAARAPHSLSLAVGDGALAGAQVHRSLILPG